jgi:hypothetical protein
MERSCWAKFGSAIKALSIAVVFCICGVGFAAERYPFNGFISSTPTTHSKTNFIQKAITWPKTSKPAGNTFSFDFIVDTQAGHDFLRVYLDGVEQDLDLYSANKGISGLNKAGRKKIIVSSSGGTHTIKFAYTKDASGSEGRDIVILDSIQFSSAAWNGIFETYEFDNNETLSSLGWSVGGQDGGFMKGTPARERSAGRPKEQAYRNSSKSYMQRTVQFPICLTCAAYKGAIEFDYFVDSEADQDWFRVYLDGVEQDLDKVTPGLQGASGMNAQGSHRIRVSTPGSHTIKFEYAKNDSVSIGRDLARVDRIKCINGDGVVFEHHDFTERDFGVTPILLTVKGQNNPAPEWTGGSTGLGKDSLGWVVHSQTPGAAYVPKQTVGESYKPTYKVFTLPANGIVDGVIRTSDYVNSTRVQLFDYGTMKKAQGSLTMIAVNITNHLHLGVKGQSRTQAIIGNEKGYMYIYLDGKRAYTLRDRDTDNSGACPDIRLPGPEDRQILLTYDIKPGDSSAKTPSVQERKGDCAGHWVELSGSESWIADHLNDVKVSEPNSAQVSQLKTSGLIHLEIKFTFPLDTNVIKDDMLGLAIHRKNDSFTAGEERWPNGNYGAPDRNNVFTWATVKLFSPSSGSAFAKAESSWFGSTVPGIDPHKLGVVK